MLNHRLPRALCALLMMGALVAFTGCGGDDKKSDSSSATPSTTATTPEAGSTGGGSVEEYKAGAEKAASDFKNSAQAASSKVQSGTSTADKVAGLEALKASVTQAADDFEALNPPDNVKADNDELVSEFRQLAASVDEVETALKTNDKAKAAAALPKLSELQTKIGATIARIQSKIGS
jgi:Sec-independent protein translocase protein TatA